MTVVLIATVHWRSALPRQRTLPARRRGLARLFSAWRDEETLSREFRHVARLESKFAETSAAGLYTCIYAEITQDQIRSTKTSEDNRRARQAQIEESRGSRKAEKENLRTNQEKLESQAYALINSYPVRQDR